MLSDDLEAWGGAVGGGLRTEGIYAHIQLMNFTVQQKLTQDCKAVMLQS